MADREVQCEQCHAKLEVPNDWQGLNAACPKCGNKFLVGGLPAGVWSNAEDGTQRLTCPHCSAALKVKPTSVGKVLICATCKQKLLAPHSAIPSGQELVARRKKTTGELIGIGLAAGIFPGAIAGLLASFGGGKLGFGAFVVYILFVAALKPRLVQVLASISFVIVAALVCALFMSYGKM